jgi:hypothetical protein
MELGANLYCNLCSYNNLRPNYSGGAGKSTSNSAFESGSNFARHSDGRNLNHSHGERECWNRHLRIPTSTSAFRTSSRQLPTTSLGTAPVANAGLPPAPGLARNSFVGPGYKDLDASLTKAFGLPNMRVLGDAAKLEIRADFFNFFNNTNLDARSIHQDITASELRARYCGPWIANCQLPGTLQLLTWAGSVDTDAPRPSQFSSMNEWRCGPGD